MPIKLNGSSSGYTQIEAAAAAGDNTLTLPTASGTLMTTGGTNTFTANQVIEVNDNSNAALRITQLGTGNALVVEDSTNPDSTPFIVDASGKVGIGTASPAYKLTSVYAGSNTTLTDYAFVGGSDTYQMIGLSENTAANEFAITNKYSSGGIITLRTGSGGTISERMRIDSSGNVGIGTASPSNFGGTNLQVQNSNIGSILWSNGTITGQLLASASAEVTVGSRSNHPLRFSTNDTERMRIDSSGNVGIGIAPSERFQIGLAFKVRTQATGDRFVAHADGNGGSQYFYYNSSNLYGTVSDRRAKDNISSIDEQEALDFIRRITPAQFSLKGQTEIQAGFIAQDVLDAAHSDAERSAIANVSSYNQDDLDCPMLGVSERPIVAMLVAAMKKQQQMIDALETRIATLENA